MLLSCEYFRIGTIRMGELGKWALGMGEMSSEVLLRQSQRTRDEICWILNLPFQMIADTPSDLYDF